LRDPFLRKREVLIKAEEETNPEYGVPPEKRSIEDLIKKGIVNLDKPPGPTSHEVVAWIKKIFGLNRAGHGGTLDPKVTGVLPIALEKATKVMPALINAGKEYVCLMRLHGSVPEDRLISTINEFIGPIYQRPPLRSSVKRVVRVRRIYYIRILEMDGKDILMLVGCERGTYIRKLCHDMGEVLGVGAHMQELRRTRVGPFREDESLITLQDLVDAYYMWKEDGNEKCIRKFIMPVERAVEHLPKIVIRDSAVDAICHGAALATPGILRLDSGIRKGDIVAIFTQKGELVALAKALVRSEQIITMDKGLAAKPLRVIMEPGVYPPLWKKKD